MNIYAFTLIGVYCEMSEPKKKKPRKDHYEEKVSFDGTFEQMINISAKQADKKSKKKKKAE